MAGPCVQGQVCPGDSGQRSSWSCESAVNPPKLEPTISIDGVAVHTRKRPGLPKVTWRQEEQDRYGTEQSHRPRVVPPLLWWSERQAHLPQARGERVPQTPPACLKGCSGTLRKTDRKMAGKMGEGGTEEQGWKGEKSQRPGAPVCGAGVHSKRAALRRNLRSPGK